jgi:hypothetical protein
MDAGAFGARLSLLRAVGPGMYYAGSNDSSRNLIEAEG